MPGIGRQGLTDEFVCRETLGRVAFPKRCTTFRGMNAVLRAISCLLVAVCMASISLSASGHSVIVIDETVSHASRTLTEAPCFDCGTHRTRVCGQFCSASPDQSILDATGAMPPGQQAFLAAAPLLRAGRAHEPPLTPPIA